MCSRSDRAEILLHEYYRLKGEPLEDPAAGIIDLMTDLMHLARQNGLDGFDLGRMAQMHFLAETETGT